MIPKHSHFIWIGGEVPGWAQANFERFASLHLNWKNVLWINGTADEIAADSINAQQYREAKSMAEKADILRYLLLERYGGIYSDIDAKFVRPLDPLIEHGRGFVSDNGYGKISNGTIAMEADHEFMRFVNERLHATWQSRNLPGIGPSKRTGPLFLTECWEMAHRLGMDVPKILAPRYFFSVRWNDKRDKEPSPDAYVVHEFRGSWLKAKQAV